MFPLSTVSLPQKLSSDTPADVFISAVSFPSFMQLIYIYIALEPYTHQYSNSNMAFNNIENSMLNMEYRRIEIIRKTIKMIHELDIEIESLEKEKMDAMELFETHVGSSDGRELKNIVHELTILIASFENEKMDAMELLCNVH